MLRCCQGIFASREDLFATPEHSDIFSDSARPLSPLCSQLRVADDTNHLTRFGCGRKAALCLCVNELAYSETVGPERRLRRRGANLRMRWILLTTSM